MSHIPCPLSCQVEFRLETFIHAEKYLAGYDIIHKDGAD